MMKLLIAELNLPASVLGSGRNDVDTLPHCRGLPGHRTVLHKADVTGNTCAYYPIKGIGLEN